jgi:hypothetical protein
MVLLESVFVLELMLFPCHESVRFVTGGAIYGFSGDCHDQS